MTNTLCRFIQFQHERSLAYPAAGALPRVSDKALRLSQNSPLLSFRAADKLSPDIVRRNIHGGSRFPDLPRGDLVFCGIESDSPLAPLILWDAAHQLQVGCSITLCDDYNHVSWLERPYFQQGLAVEARDHDHVVLRKRTALPVEANAGLERWSFCIPTGPGDATGLNAVVKRILELDVPEKEILLCGRPDRSFRYWDQVRIVGEDIPAPPVWITRKKNVLAQEARHENLCIIHDRVFLPVNFMSAMRQFGDLYPFAGFQSLWFDDRLNLSPVRYSDYHCINEGHKTPLAAVNQSGRLSAIHPELFAEFEKQEYLCANPVRYRSGNYLTGSLYIVKRNAWLHTPQDENLYWAQFEDVEQGQRCHANGIPHVIIPGAFTQSLFSRPSFYFAGYTNYMSAGGCAAKTRKVLPLPAAILKPLIKLSETEAQKKFARFSARYSQGGIAQFAGECNELNKIIAAIYSAQLPFKKSAVAAFIDDIERDILCDQLGYGAKRWLLEQFIQKRSSLKKYLGSEFYELASQFAMRPGGRRFYRDILEYFPRRGWPVRLGSWLSAWRLAKMNGDYLYHPGGVRGYYQAILDSTPFLDYASEERA